jgi:transcriptional regulator with XRE-family HTH domain
MKRRQQRKGSGVYKDVDRSGIARRVREIRLDQGWTQADLAQAIDRSVEGAARIERGKALPHPHTLRALADATGTSVAWILRGEGEKYAAEELTGAGVDQSKG